MESETSRLASLTTKKNRVLSILKCNSFGMMEKVALKVKVRLVLASRELSGVLIDIVTLKAQLHKTSIFLDIDDSIQNFSLDL